MIYFCWPRSNVYAFKIPMNLIPVLLNWIKKNTSKSKKWRTNKAQKISLQFLVISRLQNWCGYALFFFLIFFFCQPVKYMSVIHGYWKQTKFPHTQSMVAKRGHTNRANTCTPIEYMYVNKSFKSHSQHGRIPINPAILAAIGHRFIAKEMIIKIKTPTCGSRQRVRRPETRDVFGA